MVYIGIGVKPCNYPNIIINYAVNKHTCSQSWLYTEHKQEQQTTKDHPLVDSLSRSQGLKPVPVLRDGNGKMHIPVSHVSKEGSFSLYSNLY